MKVEKLYLELTRMCTIECEHCLRGCRRNEFMSLETINNVLKDIEHIELLLLTGGEPLLALKQIKELLKVVTNYNIGNIPFQSKFIHSFFSVAPPRQVSGRAMYQFHLYLPKTRFFAPDPTAAKSSSGIVRAIFTRTAGFLSRPVP